MNSKRVLVTGAAGFIGSHLADELLARGHQVIGADNLSHGLESNLTEASLNRNFRFHKVDVCDRPALEECAGPVDAVIHLAAHKIPRYGHAEDTLLVNTRGCHNALEIAARNRAKFVFASTSDVYGRNPSVPFSETSDSVLGSATVPRWSYAVSKLFGEHLAMAYAESRGIPVTILRLFGSYGPRQAAGWWGGPQSVFIDRILSAQPVPIHGDGLQTRSFCYVSDMVNGFVRVIERDRTEPEIFNLGNAQEISILELAQMIHRLSVVQQPLEFQFTPYDKISGRKYEDVRWRVPDISKATEELGFRPVVGLEEGLRRTIEWQKIERIPELAMAAGQTT